MASEREQAMSIRFGSGGVPRSPARYPYPPVNQQTNIKVYASQFENNPARKHQTVPQLPQLEVAEDGRIALPEGRPVPNNFLSTEFGRCSLDEPKCRWSPDPQFLARLRFVNGAGLPAIRLHGR